MSTILFSTINLPDKQLDNLTSLGYVSMTEIQAKSIPLILSGQDIIAQAKTGSGKTAAFSLGMLEKLDLKNNTTQALLLCPTRELSMQVATEIRKLGRYRQNLKVVVLCGGTSQWPQINALKQGAHIIVGTPGRINDHLRKETLSLKSIQTLVLDEADRMLDMGFIDDIETIAKQTPVTRQTLLFSATYPPQMEKLSAKFQRNPINVSVESQHSSDQIKQSFFRCDKSRLNGLLSLIADQKPDSAVIFCNTKQTVKDVSTFLCENNYSALPLHGDLEQYERNEALVKFSQHSCLFLVATDVASRGLDINDLPAVINYELPSDPKLYLHRIGRTGRADKTGIALSLFSSNETHRLEYISQFQNEKIQPLALKPYSPHSQHQMLAPMKTLRIKGGRKNKIRPGDILGALTGDRGIPGDHVGKINIFDYVSYVAIKNGTEHAALNCLVNGKIKGRNFRVNLLDDL